MAEDTWRLLAARGRDALLQQGDRFLVARRSNARLIALAVFAALPFLGCLPMLDRGVGQAMIVMCLALLLIGWVVASVLDVIAPLGYRYPLLTLDTHAGALLNARHQLVGALADAGIAAIGARASHGLRIRCANEELIVLQDDGDDLGPALEELRRRGLEISESSPRESAG
jgi:hypothetical protein